MPIPIMTLRPNAGLALGWSPGNPDLFPGPLSNRNVFVEGLPIAVVGDIYLPHSLGNVTHDICIATTQFNNNVYVQGNLVHLQGDRMSCDPTHIGAIGSQRTFIK